MASQTIQVLNANLPVVQGIPFKPSDNLLSKTNLRVKDPSGAVIADGSAFEVLIRQYGLKTDTTKPIWDALVGFKPTTAGTYTIDDSGAAYTASPINVTNGASDIRVQAGGVDVTINKTSNDLISSWKIGATEQLHATNRPRLRVPVTIFAGRSTVNTRAAAAQNQVIVDNGGAFTVGQSVKLYFTSTISAYYPVDSSGHPVIVTNDRYGAYTIAETPQRNFVVNRGGTPNNVVANWIDPAPSLGQLFLVNPAPTVAPVAGQTIEDKDLLDDFTANGAFTISAISGNTITLNRNLPLAILPFTTLELASGATSTNTTADFTPTTTIIERQLDQHVVVRQRGYFKSGATTLFPSLEVTVRYSFYKDSPFVKIEPRFRNYSANNAVSALDATFDQLYFLVPTATAGTGTDLVTSDAQSIARDQANTTTGTIAAGTFKLSVPKFTAYYPKGLNGDAAGLRFDIFPNTGTPHLFPRDRAARSIFFLGTNADTAADGIGFKPNARLNPVHVVATGLYRLVTSTKPATPYTATQLGGDTELAAAANTAEKLLSVAHDLAAAEAYPGGSRPAATIREFRNAAEYYPSYGWNSFGIIPWADNQRTYNHYDTQLHLLTDWLRGAPDTGFERGAECALQMADYGTFQSRFLLNNASFIQYQGINFYENDNRRTDPADGRPVGFPSHDWSGGLWTYWALTGDEATHESVLLNIQSVDQTGATVPGRLRLYNWGPVGSGSYPGAWYDNTTSGSLDIFESNDGSRWVGWAILGLIDAYRFNGDAADLAKAAQYISCFTAGEIAQGQKGYYMAASMSSADPSPTPLDNAPGSFIWPGYDMLGIIEYWRITGNAVVQSFLLRVADHLMKGDATASTPTMNALLQGGDVWTENAGKYRPVDAIYRFWQGAETTPSVAITNIATSITVASGSKLLGPGSATETLGYLIITDGVNREVVSYTGRTGNNITGVTRGLFGTTARAWTTTAKIGAGAFTDGFGGVRPTGTLGDIFLPLLSTCARISGRSDLAAMAKRIFKDIGLFRGVPGPFIDLAVATNRVYSNFRAWGAGGSSNKTFGQTAFAISQYFGDVLNNPVPVLTSLSPNSATAGASSASVSVVGSGFLAGSVVKANGVARNTTFVDATHLIVDLVSGDLAAAGIVAITVENPAPGGGTSNSLNFTVNASGGTAPTVSGLSPNTGVVNVATGAITITGTNLSGAAVTVDGVSVTPTSNTATQIVLPTQTFTSAGAKVVQVTTAGGSASSNITVSAAAPSITGIAPNTALTNTPTGAITITGQNLSNASVTVAGAAVTPTSNSATQIVLPSQTFSTTGVKQVVVTTAGGNANTPITVSVAAPSITSVTPSSLVTGSAQQITIAGQNFTGATVAFNGVNLTPSSISATQIIVTIPANLLTAAGNYPLDITNAGGTATQSINVTALTLLPSISSLAPNTVVAGSAAILLTVNGQNFDNDAKIIWNGQQLTTTVISSSQLTATVIAGLLVAAGTFNVAVLNVAANELSPTSPFIVTAVPAPTISTISPSSAVTGVATGTITISGNNLSGATVTVDGVAVIPATDTATQITLPSQTFTTPGGKAIVVTTAGGSANSVITVTVAALPTITALIPPTVTPGSPAFVLAVLGTNFTNQSAINIGGVARSTQYISPTRLETPIAANEVAVAGVLNVTITTPGGGTSPAVVLPIQTINASLPKLRAGMKAKKTTLRIAQGKTYQKVFYLRTADGTAYDLSNVTARLQVRQNFADLETGIAPLLDLTNLNGGLVIDATLGLVTINLTATQTTTLLFQWARFELEATTQEGVVVSLLIGDVRVSREYVR